MGTSPAGAGVPVAAAAAAGVSHNAARRAVPGAQLLGCRASASARLPPFFPAGPQPPPWIGPVPVLPQKRQGGPGCGARQQPAGRRGVKAEGQRCYPGEKFREAIAASIIEALLQLKAAGAPPEGLPTYPRARHQPQASPASARSSAPGGEHRGGMFGSAGGEAVEMKVPM